MNDIIIKPKQVLLGIYRKEIWDNYQFSIIELFVFDRFFNWALSDQMESIEENNIRFFLIDYKSLAPCWGMSVIYLKKIMLHLSGSLPKNTSTNLRYPLINYPKQDTRKIWHSYFTFEKNVMNTIISWNTLTPKRKVYLEAFVNNNGLFNKEELLKLLPKQEKKDVICSLNPNVEKILIELDKLRLPNKKLFSFTMPTDHKIHTQGMFNFQSCLIDLYEGRFTQRNPIKEWFKDKNKYYITDFTMKEIRNCKGNWEQINMVVQCAAKNYASWWDKNRETVNKDWLTRDIGQWMYFGKNGASMFMVSIRCKATEIREVIAEKTYNKLPSYITNLFSEFYKDEWDGLTYWNKIYSVYKWYKDNADDLITENINYKYWLDSGIDKFMQEYYDFINLELGQKYLKHFGTKNPTWTWFINNKKEEHGIDE